MQKLNLIEERIFQSQEGKALVKITNKLIRQSNEQQVEIRDIKTKLRATGHFTRKTVKPKAKAKAKAKPRTKATAKPKRR